MKFSTNGIFLFILNFFFAVIGFGQSSTKIIWSDGGNAYLKAEAGDIVQYTLPGNIKSVLVSKEKIYTSKDE